VPLLMRISARFRGRRARGPALRRDIGPGLEAATRDGTDSVRALREAARVQRAEYRAAVGRILAQGRTEQP
jgi:hypothetical protein